MTDLEKAAKAIHDHWHGYRKDWEDTKRNMPGEANDFMRKAAAAIRAIAPEEGAKGDQKIVRDWCGFLLAEHLLFRDEFKK